MASLRVRVVSDGDSLTAATLRSPHIQVLASAITVLLWAGLIWALFVQHASVFVVVPVVLAVQALVGRLTLVSVATGRDGVVVRNPLRTTTHPWATISGITLGRSGSLSAVCMLRLTDGQTIAALGIQGTGWGGVAALQQVTELRRRHREARTSAHPVRGAAGADVGAPLVARAGLQVVAAGAHEIVVGPGIWIVDVKRRRTDTVVWGGLAVAFAALGATSPVTLNDSPMGTRLFFAAGLLVLAGFTGRWARGTARRAMRLTADGVEIRNETSTTTYPLASVDRFEAALLAGGTTPTPGVALKLGDGTFRKIAALGAPGGAWGNEPLRQRWETTADALNRVLADLRTTSASSVT